MGYDPRCVYCRGKGFTIDELSTQVYDCLMCDGTGYNLEDLSTEEIDNLSDTLDLD